MFIWTVINKHLYANVFLAFVLFPVNFDVLYFKMERLSILHIYFICLIAF